MKAGEDSVVRRAVVHGVGLEVVEVREARGLRVTEPQREVSIAVMDTVTVFALVELEQVVLNDACLTHGCVLGAGGLAGNAVTEGKDVLVRSVLEGIPVDVNAAIGSGQACINEPLVWLALRVESSSCEIFFDNFPGIDVFENSNLLVNLVEFDLEELPS